jgi:hypothetical protein
MANSNGFYFKKILISLTFLLPLLTILSCSSPQKAIRQGNYDHAIAVLAKEVVNDPDQENITLLNRAYEAAQLRDDKQARALQASGQPDIWEETYRLYTKMDQRQQFIAGLPQAVKDSMGFQAATYERLIRTSRYNAARYYHALAVKYRTDNLPGAPFYIFDNLARAYSIDPDFENVRAWINQFGRTNHLLIHYYSRNDYPGFLPPGIDEYFESLNLRRHSEPAYRFTPDKPADKDFHYLAKVVVTDVDIIPEKTGELAYTETVKMQDGIAYQLDDAGQFVLDENGRKIEFPKFKTLVCYVNEYKQEKAIRLRGKVEITDRATGRVVALLDITGVAEFSNIYAKFKGDIDALSTESMALIGTKELDFPSDGQMMLEAAGALSKDAAAKILQKLKAIGD